MLNTQRENSTDEFSLPNAKVNALESENPHFRKNPFFHAPAILTHRIQRAREYAENVFIVRCMSGFKSKLKNKNWELVQPERPNQIGNDSSTNTLFFEDSKSRHSETFLCDAIAINEEPKTTSRQSSFDEEIFLLKAGIEFKQRITKELCSQFQVVRSLPQVTSQEISRKAVAVNSRLVRTTNKTLVLELNNTLISYRDVKASETGRPQSGQLITRHVSLRPGAMKLLNELYKIYEIIIYTTLDEDFTTALVRKKLDKKGVIVNGILSKSYCFKKNGYYIKDLRVLKNRDLSKVVFLDASVISACNQMDNSIIVPPYSSSKGDTALFEVLATLKVLAKAPDIRIELRKLCSLLDMYKIYLKETQTTP